MKNNILILKALTCVLCVDFHKKIKFVLLAHLMIDVTNWRNFTMFHDVYKVNEQNPNIFINPVNSHK